MTWHFAPPPSRRRKAADTDADADTGTLRALVDAALPALLAALLAALTRSGTHADAPALRTALLTGDVGQVTAVLATAAGQPLFETMEPLLLRLMTQASQADGRRLATALTTLTVEQSARIARTTQQALPGLTQTVTDWHLPVATSARLLQQMVGLTASQVRTLDRYRTLLLAEAPHLWKTRLARRVSALLRQRAERIAQHTSMQAVNTAQRLQWAQAVQHGRVDGTRLRRYWILGDDPCTICHPLPDRNPEGRALGEPFAMADGGTVQEPPVHPNCYCVIRYVEV